MFLIDERTYGGKILAQDKEDISSNEGKLCKGLTVLC